MGQHGINASGYESCHILGLEIDEVAKLVDLSNHHAVGPMVVFEAGF